MSDGEGYPGPLDDDFRPRSIDRKMDSPISSSRYSSCGESEFERYCSANSVMGTPSLCSSVGAFHECVDSDFGESTRSFGSVEGDFGLDGFNFGGRFAGKVEDEGNAMVLNRVVGGSRGGLEEEIVDSQKSKEDLGMLMSNVENVLKDANVFDDMHTDDSHLMRRGNELVVHIGFGGKFLQNPMDSEERDDDGYDERDGNFSRGEHSEGEDSMYNSGSDGENRSNVHFMGHNHHNYEAELKRGNMMLMSSSTAFGSNDWEDFEMERTENDSTSQLFDESWKNAQSSGPEFGYTSLNSLAHLGLENFDKRDQDESENDAPLASDEGHGVAESPISHFGSSIITVDPLKSTEIKVVNTSRNASLFEEKVNSDDELEYLEGCHVYNIFEKPNSLSHVGSVSGITGKHYHFDTTEQVNGHDGSQVAKPMDQLFNQEQLQSSDMVLGQVSCTTNDNTFEDIAPKNVIKGELSEFSDEYKLNSLSSEAQGSIVRIRNDVDQSNAKLPPSKGKSVELNAFYDEVVHDMEEILLEYVDSPNARQKQRNKMLHAQEPSALKDNDSIASTPGAFDGHPLTSQSTRIDGIEVIGAKQKKGDISLSERLVGVKEHTVYVIRVWSGEDQWEVERRYRDFYTLHRRLKSLFAEQGWILPSSWSAVEWDSRKLFGNSSPDVVLERSALIQECLRSIIQFNYPSGLPNALIWFLSPPNAHPNSPQSSSQFHQSAVGSNTDDNPSLGNTVSLIVDIRPHKSAKQLLEEQHYICPGCHKHLEGGKTRFQEFVQTFGLGKPRLCEYTGHLFCSSCHSNDTAVLPARVLHHWDFTHYPVSQLAKLFLDSIIDQPMLCVTAVNPFLLSKVKVLLHVVSIRGKIRALLDYVHCPFRGSIYKGLGSRKYLVESTDFFSLRNLIDLSRGAFAVLPVILETILKKIQEHITENCLVCCDVGVPCGARQSCHDISSLIFPFQDEDEIRKCHTCKLPFHKSCYSKLTECPCGGRLKPDVVSRSMSRLSLMPSGGNDGGDEALSLFRMKSDLGLRSSTDFLSKLLPIEKRETAVTDNQDSNNVILMGSLPNNSL